VIAGSSSTCGGWGKRLRAVGRVQHLPQLRGVYGPKRELLQHAQTPECRTLRGVDEHMNVHAKVYVRVWMHVCTPPSQPSPLLIAHIDHPSQLLHSEAAMLAGHE